jgi:S1-C subfamily serine protease
MTPETENTLPRRELLSGSAIKIRIAVVSSLVLAVGSWLAPRAAQTQVAPSQELAAPLLEEQVQQREASQRFVGVQDIAAQVRQHSVAVMTAAPAIASRNDFSGPPAALPAAAAGFGVYISDTRVLAHSRALDGRSSAPLSVDSGRTVEGQVVAYEPSTGLVLLRTEPAGVPPVILASEAPPAGALAVGVGRSEGHDMAVPVFVTAVVGGNRYTIGAVNESILPGMPVFTLGGELFAVAAPDGGETRAIPAREAADRLLALEASGERHSSLGLGFQAPTGALARTFGEQGVVITAVVEGGPADLAGLQAGDVLLRVGEVVIDSVDTATQALRSSEVGAPVSVRIRRANRVREVEATPALAYAVAALAAGSTDGATGPEARVLFPAAVLQQSVIPPTARVLAVNGRPLTSRAQAQRALRTARTPVPVLLRQGNNRFFVAIEPTR